MYDRIPSPGKENRVRIVQDNGQAIEGRLEYADDATQEGSQYTKGNVLPDDVCWLMDLDFDESEPDDAFRYLALMNATVYGGIAIRVISNGLPLSGITFSVTGTGNVTTDSQGYVFLRKPPGNYTATFTSTLDLVFSPASFRVTATAGKINAYTVEADEASVTQQTFTSSTTINFSDRVSDFDVFAVGGGGSGGAAAGFSYGNGYGVDCFGLGGAGGRTVTMNGVQYDGQQIQISIGAGGTPATANANQSDVNTALGNRQDGNDGGDTTVSLGGSVVCTAPGGERGGGSYDYDQISARDGSDGGSGSGGAGFQYSWSIGDSGSDGGNGSDSEYQIAGAGIGGKGQGTNTKAFGASGGISYSPAGGSAGARSRNTAATGSPGQEAGYTGGRAAAKMTTSSTDTVTAYAGNVAGAGGGGAAIAHSNQIRGANLTATSGAGQKGLVIIRWRYK